MHIDQFSRARRRDWSGPFWGLIWCWSAKLVESRVHHCDWSLLKAALVSQGVQPLIYQARPTGRGQQIKATIEHTVCANGYTCHRFENGGLTLLSSPAVWGRWAATTAEESNKVIKQGDYWTLRLFRTEILKHRGYQRTRLLTNETIQQQGYQAKRLSSNDTIKQRDYPPTRSSTQVSQR